MVCQLAGLDAEPVARSGGKTMLVVSVIAMVACIAWAGTPTLPFATSVQSSWREIDVLWRSDGAKQFTGFLLLAVTSLGLIFSLRKRVTGFRWGSYSQWRSIHGLFGLMAVFMLAVHTGFRLGANLNWILGVCFLSASAFGAVAGILSSLETRATGHPAIWLRRWRPHLTKWHLWVTWPLPALIVLHILSFYWFSD